MRTPDLFRLDGKVALVTGGAGIVGRPIEDQSLEVFQTYLLGAVLSFALLKQGIDPIHATVVVVDGMGIALLGNTGYGKSTLAAAFLASGHRLLTDDLLVVSRRAEGLLLSAGHAVRRRLERSPAQRRTDGARRSQPRSAGSRPWARAGSVGDR